MSSPTFSIIVPVYNTEQYLNKCLSSIQNQSYKDFEVIVVNDGSPDGSELVIDKFVRDDARFIKINKQNGGLSSARNSGIDKSKGKFIAFIDSDDWIGENFLSSFLPYIDEADIIICGYTLVDTVINRNIKIYQKNTEGIQYRNELKDLYILLQHIGPMHKNSENKPLNFNTMPVWKNIYSHNLIENNKLRFISEREIMLEDYFFNLLAYQYANTIITSESTEYFHVIVNGSLSRKYRRNMLEMMINLFVITKKTIDGFDIKLRDNLNAAYHNFILKSSVDILYNSSLSNENEFEVKFNSLRYSEQFVSSIPYSKSICLPFYYRYFLKLLINKKSQRAYRRFLLAKKLNYLYRFYKMIYRN